MSEVTKVTKRGDTYRVEGREGDRKVSVDIHAKNVEGRSQKDADAFFKRSIRTVDEATRGK